MRPLAASILALTIAAAHALGGQSVTPTPAGTGGAPPAPREARSLVRTATDGTISASLTAPADVVEVGTPIEFSLTVTATAGVAVTMPDIPAQFGPFETSGVMRSALPARGATASILRFVASTYESGVLATPVLTVEWKDAAGTEGTLEIPAAEITVMSLVGGKLDPAIYRDIKGPVEINLGRSWWWLVVVGGVIGAGASTYYLWTRRAAARERAQTPDEWALAQLARLQCESLVARGELHTYWVRLSDVVRQYIERRFEIAAPEQTTKEFLARAGDHPLIGAEHRHLLTDFLRAADMVKFAAYRPLEADCVRGMEAARGFVEETTPTTATAEVPAEKAGVAS